MASHAISKTAMETLEAHSEPSGSNPLPWIPLVRHYMNSVYIRHAFIVFISSCTCYSIAPHLHKRCETILQADASSTLELPI